MTLRRLVLSNFTQRRVRTALTVAAVALAVSLVVAVTTGYRSAEETFTDYISYHFGSTHVQISNGSDPRKGVRQDILDTLRTDPDVVAAFGRLEVESGLIDKDGKPVFGPAVQLTGLSRPLDDDIIRTPIADGAWFDTSDGDVAVIDQGAAETMKVGLGGTVYLPGADGSRHTFRVVGICIKPGFFIERGQYVYLPLKRCQEVSGNLNKVTRVMIRLTRADADQAFAARWKARLAAIDPELRLRPARESRREMERQLDGTRFLSYLAGAVSLLSAAFIIFSTLSMGVTERQRTLAMLRAIGAQRSQVARAVLLEASLIGGAGALAGLPLGLLWAWILSLLHANFFTSGVVINWSGMGMALLGGQIAAFAAALLPAWNASRTSPLEAMAPLARPPSLRAPLVCAAIGMLLIWVDSALLYLSGFSRDVKFYAHFLVGLPCLMFGFFLLSPLVVWVVEAIFVRIAARITRADSGLLRQQLSGGVWRAAGTGSALMLGLAILVVLQTMGQSLLAGWRIPRHFPDVFIWTPNRGLPKAQWAQLEKVEGIRKGQLLPMVIGMPELGGGIFAIVGSAVLPDATMFIGVPPDQAMQMMELEFREGDPRSAAEAMKKGRHIIITEEFRTLKGLHLGDKLALKTRTGMKDFTICGVVWSPGIDVVVTMFDLQRAFDERTVATVFGSIDDAEKEFGWDQAYFFAANLDTTADKGELLKKVRAQVGDRGWKAGDIRRIKQEIVRGMNRILLLVTTISLAAMAVAAFGVANTVMASVRSRLWQFGILRSIGLTGNQLLRLVLAEALLLGLIGTVLGLAAGFLMTFNGMGMSRYMLGYVPGISVPWWIIAGGVAVTLAVALLASLWPAIWAARSQPLDLLQAGRSAG